MPLVRGELHLRLRQRLQDVVPKPARGGREAARSRVTWPVARAGTGTARRPSSTRAAPRCRTCSSNYLSCGAGSKLKSSTAVPHQLSRSAPQAGQEARRALHGRDRLVRNARRACRGRRPAGRAGSRSWATVRRRTAGMARCGRARLAVRQRTRLRRTGDRAGARPHRALSTCHGCVPASWVVDLRLPLARRVLVLHLRQAE